MEELRREYTADANGPYRNTWWVTVDRRNISANGFSLPSQSPPEGGTSTSRLKLNVGAPVHRCNEESEFVSGLNAAPFHSTPPWIPGQKRTRWSRESGPSTFSREILVVNVCERSGRTAVRSAGGEPRLTRERSRIERRPSLSADATIRLPERV